MSISNNTWRSLFILAVRFKQAAPWNWMLDSDLFAVKLADGQTGYCTIMGSDDDIFGMTVYPGAEGLYTLMSLQDLMDEESINNPNDAVMSQRCYMFCFESEEDLFEEEVQAMKAVNLRFKGKGNIPIFRDFTPGFVPWVLETEEQADFLAQVLEQAIEICLAAQENPDYLINPDETQDLLRARIAKEEGGTVVWEDAWIEPEDYEAPSETIKVTPTFLHNNLERIPAGEKICWMAEVYTFSEPIQDKEDERPYFPEVLLMADSESGMITSQTVFKPKEMGEKLQKELIEAFKENGCVPEVILCADEDTLELLQPFAEFLKCKMEVSEDAAEFLAEIKAEIFEEQE